MSLLRVIAGLITDSLARSIRADASTHALLTIKNGHFETHEGDHYFVKTFLADAGGAASTTHFSFTTPDSEVQIHAKALLAPDADYQIDIQEGAVVSGGTPVTGMNNDRNSENVALLQPVASPSVDTPGDVIWSARNGGGKNPVGVAPGLNYEIIAKRNTTYVFELVKQGATSAVVDIDFWWYEHTPKD